MVANFLGRLKNRPRFALAILFVGACGYAIDRWFLARVMTGKSIGLSEYEQKTRELQKQSEICGDVALVLGIVAFVLVLSAWPARSTSEATHGILTATPKENRLQQKPDGLTALG